MKNAEGSSLEFPSALKEKYLLLDFNSFMVI